jgi:DNA-binding HxlR family transcriptional regulator
VTEYAQFCAVARAAEIVGERWTLLILRELHLGPRRFSDLKSRLDPIAPGVLQGRLRALESRGIIAREDVPPPTPARLYSLTQDGRDLQPVLFELLRWGARYLFPQRPGERFEPEWLRMVLSAYASTSPSVPMAIDLSALSEPRTEADATPAAVVRGGPEGTAIEPPSTHPTDAQISATPRALLGLMSGRMALEAAEAAGEARVAGDREAAGRLSELFAMG